MKNKIKKRSFAIITCLLMVCYSLMNFKNEVKAADDQLEMKLKGNNTSLNMSLIDNKEFSFAGLTFIFPAVRNMQINDNAIEVTEGDTFTIEIDVPYYENKKAAAIGATLAYDNTQIEFISSEFEGLSEDFRGIVKIDKSGNAVSSIYSKETPSEGIHNEQLMIDIGPVNALDYLNIPSAFTLTLTFKAKSSDLSNGLYYYITNWLAAKSTVDDDIGAKFPRYLIQTEGKERVKTALETPTVSLSADSVNGGLSYEITDSNGANVDHFEIQLYEEEACSTTAGSAIEAQNKKGTIPLSSDVLADTTYYAKVKAIASADSLDYKDSLESIVSSGAVASKIKLKTPSVSITSDKVNGGLKVMVTDSANIAGSVSKYSVEVFEADAVNKPTGSAVYSNENITKDTQTAVTGVTSGKKYVATVKAIAQTNGNYMDSDVYTMNSSVANKGKFPDGLSIIVNNDLKYTGSPVNVNPQISGSALDSGVYGFKYKGRNTTNYTESTTAPTLPGDYTVTMYLNDSGKEIYIEPASYPSKDFTIAKGTQSATLTVNGAEGNTYTIGKSDTAAKAVISGLKETPAVTYTVEAEGTGSAAIAQDGTLTISKAGTLILKAEYSETTNYISGEVTYTLTVNKGTLKLASSSSSSQINEEINLATLIKLKNEHDDEVTTETVTYNVQSNSAGVEAGSKTSITPTASGTIVIKVSTASSDLYNALSDAEYTITVNDLPKTTITFHDGNGKTETQSITEKTPANLRLNTFEKDGYTFDGWSTSSGSSTVAYADGAEYKAESGNQSIDLYAVWKAIPINGIKYENLNSAEVNKEYTSGTPTVDPSSIAGGNYKFELGQAAAGVSIEESTGVITFTPNSIEDKTFKVKVTHSNGSTAETTVTIKVVLNKLDAPNALTSDDVTITNKSITIKASNSSYEYLLKKADGTEIKTMKGNGAALTFDGLRADTGYILVQRAKGDNVANSDSDWSAEYKPRTSAAEVPVIGTVAPTAKDSSISLSWNVTDDGGADITKAVVSYKYKEKVKDADDTEKEAEQTASKTFDTLNNAKSVTLTGLTNGIEYYDIQVVLTNSAGNSQPSNSVKATPKKESSGGGSIGGGSSKNEGWKEEKDGTYYYENGKPVTGFKEIEKKTYYFNDEGKMVKGFSDIKNKTYYFDEKGVMKKADWFSESRKRYYAYEDGVIAKGWLPIESDWYYMNPTDGHLMKDWVRDGSDWYFMGPEDGKLWRQHWAPDNSGNWYYVDLDGKMIVNTWIPSHSGYWYYIGSDGKMVSNAMVEGCWINSLGIYQSPTYQG